jgi:lipopolysaccharide transport system ATP-binding protein
MSIKTNLIETPTIFHITHWKAGSQWIHRILREIDLARIVSPELHETQFLKRSIIPGGIYPTLYLTREQFYSVPVPAQHRRIILFRDLRDTLISGYFSIRYSHAIIDEQLSKWRNELERRSVEDGLLLLIDEWLPLSANIQRSWISANESFIRYEDLLKQEQEHLRSLFLQLLDLPISIDRLDLIISNNRFETFTGGRKPGFEDLSSHERKGISGDWKNYFTKHVNDHFNQRFGELTTLAGYSNN